MYQRVWIYSVLITTYSVSISIPSFIRPISGFLCERQNGYLVFYQVCARQEEWCRINNSSHLQVHVFLACGQGRHYWNRHRGGPQTEKLKMSWPGQPFRTGTLPHRLARLFTAPYSLLTVNIVRLICRSSIPLSPWGPWPTWLSSWASADAVPHIIHLETSSSERADLFVHHDRLGVDPAARTNERTKKLGHKNQVRS